MKISVIIPVYNGEKYLAQCIENVLHQTYKDIEIIVVNDGSTDGTAAIAAKYPEVKLISQPNGGISVSRNNGAKVATGDYIHFLDADDLLCLDYYQRMAEAISLTGADMAFGGVVNEGLPNQAIKFDHCMLLLTTEDKMFVTNVVELCYVWRYLIRRSLIEQEKLLFPAGRLFEDIYFSLEAASKAASIVTVPGAVYYYKKRPGSILNTRNKEFSRHRRRELSLARAFRRQFLADLGIERYVVPLRTFKYKLLGIPLLKKVILNDGKTRWYLLGLRILQKK